MKTIKVTILKSDMPKSNHYQNFDIIEEFEVPYDFIKNIMESKREQVSMQFEYNGINYDHTLVKHPTDKQILSEEEAVNKKAHEAFQVVGDLIRMMNIPIDLNAPTSSNSPEQS